jgi:hypothetical protein
MSIILRLSIRKKHVCLPLDRNTLMFFGGGVLRVFQNELVGLCFWVKIPDRSFILGDYPV